MLVSQRLSDDFISFVRRLFIRQISAFVIVLGRRGSGKTDFSLLLAEILNDFGIIKYFATNIDVFKSHFMIEEITNLDDLTQWCKDNKGKKLFIFDEIAKAMPRRKPMASLTVDLINQFQILRKYKLSIIATTISDKNTDSAILDPSTIDGYFNKPMWNKPQILTYFDYLEDLPFIDWFDIPKTSIHYDTYSSAPFTKHGVKKKPAFKTKELNYLWELTHGADSKALGLHPQQVARLWRKFVKTTLEEGYHISH